MQKPGAYRLIPALFGATCKGYLVSLPELRIRYPDSTPLRNSKIHGPNPVSFPEPLRLKSLQPGRQGFGSLLCK